MNLISAESLCIQVVAGSSRYGFNRVHNATKNGRLTGNSIPMVAGISRYGTKSYAELYAQSTENQVIQHRIHSCTAGSLTGIQYTVCIQLVYKTI